MKCEEDMNRSRPSVSGNKQKKQKQKNTNKKTYIYIYIYIFLLFFEEINKDISLVLQEYAKVIQFLTRHFDTPGTPEAPRLQTSKMPPKA